VHADTASVTIFARPLPTGRRSSAVRVAVPAILLAVLVCLLLSASAGAVVTTVTGIKVGLQPRNGTQLKTPGEEPKTFADESGNVVLHGSSDYAIYWDPSKQLHHEWLVNLDGFFQALGEAGLGAGFADLGQYRDRSNAITQFQALFKGAYSDTVKFPSPGCTDPKPLVKGAVTCLTSAQLREQLQSFIATHGLPTGMSTVYYLLTPPGVTVCVDPAATSCSDYKLTAKEESEEKRESVSYKNSFCSYHDDINPGGTTTGDANTILYAAIPWTAGTAGLPVSEYNPGALVYRTAFDCQDGGFNPEKHEEHEEVAPALTLAEEEALTKDTPEQREEAETVHRLLGPHQEEPHQAGKGETGDYGSGLSDLLVNQIAEEQMNIVTDPLLSSWQDAKGNEVTDLCRNTFAATAGPTGGAIGGSVKADLHTEAGTLSNVTLGTRSFYINNVFNQAEERCDGGVGLVARFTAPNPVNAGEIIGVDGMESTVSLIKGKAFGPTGPPTTTYATFSWNFGDGTPEVTGYAPGAPTCEAPWLSPCAASAFHSYQYGGVYHVTLRITDVAGNTTSVIHDVSVNGPLPPAPSSGSATSTPAVASNTVSGSSSGSASASFPKPVAAAAVVSRSLRSVLRHGLVVRYSVSEQVAGHFEVLLSQPLARHLGISGALAVGLPAGTPPQVVIAKAIVVTTSAGRSTVTIQLSKRTATRLGRLHKVTLMVRLIVRNASSRTPATTTVLSKFTLGN
jgi:hypothetical protein